MNTEELQAWEIEEPAEIERPADLPGQQYIVGTPAYYDRLDLDRLIEHVRAGIVGASIELRRRVEEFAADRFDLSCRVCLVCFKEHQPAAEACSSCGTETLAFLAKENDDVATTAKRRKPATKRTSKADPAIVPAKHSLVDVPQNDNGEVFGRENGRTAWRCIGCGAMEDGELIRCIKCNMLRVDLNDFEHMLAEALERDQFQSEVWRELRHVETDDEKLIEAIHEALVGQPKEFVSTARGPVAYVTGPMHQALIGSICIWFDSVEPGDPSKGLRGAEMLQAVRRLYGIPGGKAEPSQAAATPAKKSRKKPARPAALDSASRDAPESRMIDVDDVSGFPWNCRDEEEFEEAGLRELGESLRRKQLQAIAVMEIVGESEHLSRSPYVGIFGERRWRAAKLVGIQQLRADVHQVDEATAIEMVGVENEKRQDWSAVAKARWLAKLKGDCGLSDAELAERTGGSKSDVATTLQLLKLPAEWQQLLISRAITPYAVRPLTKFAETRPQVLDAAAVQLRLPFTKTNIPRNFEAEPISSTDVEQALFDALKTCTRTLTPSSGDWDNSGIKFSLTKGRKEELDVEKLKVNRWHGEVNRAWNVKRWNELQKEAKARRKAEEKKKAGSAKGKAAKMAKPVTPNPRDLAERWVTWNKRAVAARLEKKVTKRDQAFLLHWAMGMLILDFECLDNIDNHFFGRKFLPTEERFAKWLQLPAAGAAERAVEICRTICAEPDGMRRYDTGDPFAPLARHFGIDPAETWQPTAQWLELLSIEQLKALARDAEIWGPGMHQLPHDVQAKGEKASIEWLLENWPKKPAGVPAVFRAEG